MLFYSDVSMEGRHINGRRHTSDSGSQDEFHDPWGCNPEAVGDNKEISTTTKKENPLTRFYKRRSKSGKDKRMAYRPMVESIDEDTETEHVSCTWNHNTTQKLANPRFEKTKKKRNKLQEKSATFDYADLQNEVEFPSRINVRRTAICAKSKSTDALQLESFIVVSRLKQFDLI